MKSFPRAIAACGVLATLLGGPALPASASSAQSLLNRAVQNTNSVRTIVTATKRVVTSKNLSLTAVIRGAEDEVANRERDTEVVTAVGRTSTGTKQTIHYTLDIIFSNGKTYYRSTLDKNTWHSRKGMAFADSLTGVQWTRARTTVGAWTPLTLVGQAGSSGAHFRGHTSKAQGNLPLDVWISSGVTPYVTREVVTQDAVVRGQHVRVVQQTTYGPFNQPISIAEPASGST